MIIAIGIIVVLFIIRWKVESTWAISVLTTIAFFVSFYFSYYLGISGPFALIIPILMGAAFLILPFLPTLFGSGSSSSKSNSSGVVDEEFVELVDIAVNHIGPRYPGEIALYAYTHCPTIDFEEFDQSYSDFLHAIIHKTSVSSCCDYDFCLQYYKITERHAELLRRWGHLENRCWRVESNRNISPATLAKVKEIAKNHSAEVSVIICGDDTDHISFRCKPVRLS